MNIPTDGNLGTILFTTLTGAVAFLFKLLMDNMKASAAQGERLGKLEGKQDGVTRLHAETLDVVFKAARMSRDELPELLPEESER